MANTYGVLKFGIWWPKALGDEGSPHLPGVMAQAADQIYLVAWYAVSLLAILGLRLLCRSKSIVGADSTIKR
jgi:hypothetical protein